MGEHGAGDQSVAVFHQQIAHGAEPGRFGPLAFLNRDPLSA